MRTSVMSASLKKTDIDGLYEVSTVDARDVGLGFETVAFKIENRFPFRFQLVRMNCDSIGEALANHELICAKYEAVANPIIQSSGTKNAIIIIDISPEELLKLAQEYTRIRDAAPRDSGRVTMKLSDSISLVTKPIQYVDVFY